MGTGLVLKSKDGQRDVTTSLIVAEVFDKNHADVLRDIRNLHCSPAFFERNFAECLNIIPLKTGESRQKYYEISKDGFSFLVMGYTGEKAAEFKEKFILEFNKREALLKNEDYIISQAHMFLERRTKRLEDQLLEKEKQLEIAESTIKESAPKVEYFNEVLRAIEGITTTIIAKDLGMSPQALNKILEKNGVIYKSQKTYVLYQKYANRGYTKTKTFYHPDDTGTKTISEIHTYWTEAGRKFIMDGVKKIRSNSLFDQKQ